MKKKLRVMFVKEVFHEEFSQKPLEKDEAWSIWRAK